MEARCQRGRIADDRADRCGRDGPAFSPRDEAGQRAYCDGLGITEEHRKAAGPASITRASSASRPPLPPITSSPTMCVAMPAIPTTSGSTPSPSELPPGSGIGAGGRKADPIIGLPSEWSRSLSHNGRRQSLNRTVWCPCEASGLSHRPYAGVHPVPPWATSGRWPPCDGPRPHDTAVATASMVCEGNDTAATV
jgi:hypothetical protein